MKVYFVGSISGKKKYLSNYEAIIKSLKDLGHQVLEYTLEPTPEFVYEEMTDHDKIVQYKRVLGFIQKCDIMVAESSHPSLGVGYEISLCIERNKPVVVLYSEGKSPHFLEGLVSDKLIIETYDRNSISSVLKASLDYASEQQDTRFNFFISPKIAGYLDWVSKEKRLPRAVYLRKLIEDHMNNNQEYMAA